MPQLNYKAIVDQRPLTVTPNTSVLEAIALMGKAQRSCTIPSLNVPIDSVLMNGARASSVWVTESSLLGVFTENEATRAIASGEDLAAIAITEVMKQASVTTKANEDVFTLLSLLRQHHRLPILENGQLKGTIGFESIRPVLHLDELLRSCSLSEIMFSVPQAPATTSIWDLIPVMAQGSYVVLTAQDRPVGIITARDIIQLHSLKVDLHQKAAAVMGNLLCLRPTDSVLVAHWEMQQQCLQQAAIANEAGELLGLVTPISFLQTLDLAVMKTAAQQLQQSIEQFVTKEDAKDTQIGEENPAELLEQLERNRLLTAIALRIHQSLDLNEILNTAVTEVRQFLQSDRAIVYRFNPDLSGTVVIESVAEGWLPTLGSTIKDDCFAKDYAGSYQEGRLQVTEDIYTAGLSQCHIDILVLFNIRANLVVPILQGEHLWGLLCAYQCSEPRRWRQFEVDLLKQLATQIAIAIQQSELHQQVRAELAERKRAEEQLKASLREKEVLLKEIHHRVKNNLQIISSLLKLQSAYIKEPQTIDMFKDSQNRIRSMALIHEKLYQSKNLSKIDFAEYIRDLTGNLLRSYKTSLQAIKLKTDIQDIKLNIDTAIPCGLIINELVSNSLKHAFTATDRENEISITIYPSQTNQFWLIISDNGSGFPSHLDFQNTESLGLELVCTLTEQLEGTIELDSSQGTTFKINFSEIGAIRN